MEKSTVYLIISIVLAVTILGVAGEYFTYKYYSIMVSPQPAQTQLPTPTTTPQGTVQNPNGSSANSITFFQF